MDNLDEDIVEEGEILEDLRPIEDIIQQIQK